MWKENKIVEICFCFCFGLALFSFLIFYTHIYVIQESIYGLETNDGAWIEIGIQNIPIKADCPQS
jgi:hypothetical protein